MKTWKNFFPLFRCPKCRSWLRIRGRSEYKMVLASKRDIAEVKADSPASDKVLSSARTREEDG